MLVPVVFPDSGSPDSRTDGAAFLGDDESKQRPKSLSTKSFDDDDVDDDDVDDASNGGDVDAEQQQPIPSQRRP